MKNVLFTIRRNYFDAIVSGEKTEEIRSFMPRWNWLLGPGAPQVAVFLCGHDVHRRYIKRIYVDDVVKVLGRSVSEQGRKDLHFKPGENTKACVIVELGAEFTNHHDKEVS